MASVDGSKSVQDSSDDGSRLQCSPCEYEGVKKEAQYYCPQCKDHLCDPCQSVHQKISSTRSHKIVSGSLMPTKPENINHENIKQMVQCPCGGKDITIYCKDHIKVMCVDCKTLKHRNCNCLAIEDACADSNKMDANATKERMETLKAKFENLQQRRNEDAENLTAKSAESRDIVEEFKRELIRKIEEMTETALDDLAKCDKEQRLTIEQHLQTCIIALKRIELDHRPFQKAVIAGINPLIFIYNLQLKETLEQMDSVLQDVGKEVKEPEMSFELNEALKMTDTQRLGVVRSTSFKDTRQVVADMKIKSVEKVDVKFPADQSEPRITGSLFMPNGELTLCDCVNCSVKVLNTDFTQKEQIRLSSEPWDLCPIEDEEIVISQPIAKTLLFMKVLPKLQTGSFITLDQSCYGVEVKDGLIYVSFDSGEIRVLDKTGQPQRNIYSGFSFKRPYYISVMLTGMVYVSEYNGNNIRVLKDGKEISNYSNAGISGPYGMYIDGAGNILVCEGTLHNLRVTDAKRHTLKVLLSGADGLRRPHTVSFRPDDKTLIIGGNTQQLVVCKMAFPKMFQGQTL